MPKRLLATLLPTRSPTPLDGAAVRDTLRHVFRDPAFAERSWGELLFLRLVDLMRGLIALVRGSGVSGPAVFWTAVAVLAAVVTAVLVRYTIRREALPRRRGGAAVAMGDAWMEAEVAAREGRYDVAAHRLYAAVVAALAQAGLVRVHASKTAGDYLRELRRGRPAERVGAAGSRDAAQAFAPFARGYQAVVYGPRAVDRARYEALRASALPLLGPVDRP